MLKVGHLYGWTRFVVLIPKIHSDVQNLKSNLGVQLW